MPAPAPTIHILKPGMFRSGGRNHEFSEADLGAIAAAYDPAAHEAPVVIGHPKTDAPAMGWVGGLRTDRRGLHALPRKVDAQFAEMVREGRFQKVSASFYGPGHPDNPKGEGWYLRHVGFLGAQPPVVKGLQQVQFSEADPGNVAVVELELAEISPWAVRTIHRLFDGVRDLLIEKFDRETADQVLPQWDLETLATEAGRLEEDGRTARFAESGNPAPEPTPDPEEDDDVSKGPTEAELAERQAKLDAREAALDRQAKDARKADAAAFAETLAAGGKILPRDQAPVAELLTALPADATVDFAEDADSQLTETPLVQWLRGFLERCQQVDLSEAAPTPASSARPQRPAGLKVPAGYSVASDQADLHRRALDLSEKEGVSYDTAVIRLSQGQGA